MIGSRPRVTLERARAVATAAKTTIAATPSAPRITIHQRSSTWPRRRAAAWGGGESRLAARRSRCAGLAPSCAGADGAKLGAPRAVRCAELRGRGSARRVLRAVERCAPGRWPPACAGGRVSRPDATRTRTTPRREPRVSRAGSAVYRGREPTPARAPSLDAVAVIVNPDAAAGSPRGSACAPPASGTVVAVGCEGAAGAGATEPLAAGCPTGAACDGCGAGAGAAAGAGGGLAAPRGGSRLEGST